jgi:acyl-coenzyme A thioesterase PaaI-like protein
MKENAASKKTLRTVRTAKGIKEFTYLGCPLTRNRSAWCYRLCPPDAEGNGQCGRVAPHSLKSSTQMAIANYKKRQLQEHFGKLENMYLSAPCNDHYDPGIRISEGMAEILIPIRKEFLSLAGAVQSAVYYKALVDSAVFSVNSTVDRVLVTTVAFTTHFTEAAFAGVLIARGRYVGSSEDHFWAESVLTDAEGKELARANGTFVASETALSADIGYE